MALLATDRCDRCMAQAVAQVDHLSWAATLLLCAHHLHEHLDYLNRVLAVIVDDRDSRQVTP